MKRFVRRLIRAVATLVVIALIAGGLYWAGIEAVYGFGIGIFILIVAGIIFLVMQRRASPKSKQEKQHEEPAKEKEPEKKPAAPSPGESKGKGGSWGIGRILKIAFNVIMIGLILWFVYWVISGGLVRSKMWQDFVAYGDGEPRSVIFGPPPTRERPNAQERDTTRASVQKDVGPPVLSGGTVMAPIPPEWSRWIWIPEGYKLVADPGLGSGLIVMECIYNDELDPPGAEDRGRQWEESWRCPDARWVRYQADKDLGIEIPVLYHFERI